jgi:hypothetical protein
MGYELDKLKQQYGVSSPVRAPYAGPAAPVMPVMPTKPTDPKSSQTEYDKQKAAYDAYVADPSAFNELMRKYELAQREYGQYRDEFSNRMMNTPMYGAEYDIGLKNTTRPVTYDKPLQAPGYGNMNLDAAPGSTDTDTNTFMPPPSSTEAINSFHRTNPLDVLSATRPGHDMTARYNAVQDATRSQFAPMPPSSTEAINSFHRTNPLDALSTTRPGHDMTARYNAVQDATRSYNVGEIGRASCRERV